ncbi:MAG TPA: NADH-quinone oxidoreductase subunit N [Thermoplasmata archaeon]|nr:NADH-quinone oxidoreductase subunit N [Thermoplasmata archaeon]
MVDTALLSPFLPEIVLLGAGLLVLLADRAGVERREYFGAVALAGLLFAFLLVLADAGLVGLGALRTIPASSVDVAPTAGVLYAFSSLGLLFQSFFLLAAGLVALAFLSGPSRGRGAPVAYGLLLFATLGMLLVAVSADLIVLLLALELTAISSYLLVGYTRREPRGLEAAMKFYIIGALSAALSFFGASLLYGAYGTTSLAVIGHTWPSGSGALASAGYGFLLVGLGFEVTAVPFHMWAVDVYDGAPNEVSAFLAGGTKKMGLFAVFLLFTVPLLLVGPLSSPAGSARESLQIALAILALLTMTLGNVLALLQKEMKRLLAYSSISQAGYMLLGVTVATAPGLTGASMQIFAHVLLKTGAFLVVAAAAALGVGPLVSDWRGLGVRRPYLSAAFALFLLGLAGIPLTVGFVSKFVLFAALVQAQGLFLWLAIAGLLNSALSVFYYARVLKTMYVDAPPTLPPPIPGPAEPPMGALGGIGWGRAGAISLAAVAVVALGVYPQPVLSALGTAAQHFLGLGL